MTRIIKLIIWILIIVIWYFYFSYSSFTTKPLINEKQDIYVKKWWTFYSVWEKLNLDKTYLKIYLKYNKPDFELKEWNYTIKKDSNIKEILEQLKNTTNSEKRLTILEWWNIYDIDNYLTEKLLIKEWDFIDSTKNKLYFSKYPFLTKANTLEWFLYPDTYNIIPDKYSNNDLIEKMLNNFKNRAYNWLLSKYSGEKIVEIINLASIVEKEANVSDSEEEVSIIAWILKKRLDEGWYLWADATVCYPYKITSKKCTPSFVNNNIDQKDDYNTRKKLWLPKTPIANPSIISIKAIIYPKDTPYYFYLHDKNWKVHYGKNLEEHNVNKEKYIQ